MDERSQNESGIVPEISAVGAGRNDLPAPAAGGQAGLRVLSAYPNLLRLRNLFAGEQAERPAGRNSPAVSELQNPISVSQLEMLEAELQNQGILPARKDRTKLLSQFANYEIDLWRWRARRVGSQSIDLQFAIDTPRYVVHCALNLLKRYEQTIDQAGGENSIADAASGVMAAASGLIEINNSWIIHISSDTNLPANLLYLERIATYVLGGYGRALNRFQRGLNVVLRALGSPKTAGDSLHTVRLVMPFSRPDFFRTLKSVKDSD